MVKTANDTRQRLVAATADMIRRRGLNATSVRELAKFANTPLGSTYHYFPGGKTQMVQEAIEWTQQSISGFLQKVFAEDPVQGLDDFLARWRVRLLQDEFNAGCPLLAVVMEEPANDDAKAGIQAAGEAFKHWQATLAAMLMGHGLAEQEARSLAILSISALEGSIILCRAEKSLAPLDTVAQQLRALFVQKFPKP
ncbi:TetR/AcrR family transcriptional regulator [Bowmanella sp. Y26]|uniref:TetR/AcrR family transcriptional regulator n=1 Tax=Bowmanella yangjiangensis TaxID=2811230 RepID=UPI001BDD335A|nr:helix-turn-helix domain-containing protein [Bowmanella yangjiangensis]MBT1065122.1 TetR/AcrR family transcriptional regulator [Bowmanella yangjiangensis]